MVLKPEINLSKSFFLMDFWKTKKKKTFRYLHIFPFFDVINWAAYMAVKSVEC